MGCSESKSTDEQDSNKSYDNKSLKSHKIDDDKIRSLTLKNTNDSLTDNSDNYDKTNGMDASLDKCKSPTLSIVKNDNLDQKPPVQIQTEEHDIELIIKENTQLDNKYLLPQINELKNQTSTIIQNDKLDQTDILLNPVATRIDKLKQTQLKSSTQLRTKVNKCSSDKYINFIQNGGRINSIIRNHKVPEDWNKLQANKFPIGLIETERNGSPCVSITIHMEDSEDHVKRQFLAFFNLKISTFSPEEFSDWCNKMMMHNTMADYMSLYYLSKSVGNGSIILNAIKKYPGAIEIKMSDRFFSGRGMLRAVRFTAKTRRQACIMFKAYITSMSPKLIKGTIMGLYYQN